MTEVLRKTVVEINGGEAKGQAVFTKGKSTGLALFKGKLPIKVHKVRIIGREDATNAERSRDGYVLSVLQGLSFLNTSAFVQMLWFELSETVAIPALPSLLAEKDDHKQTSKIPQAFRKLNPSQCKVAMAMISCGRPLVVAHGESQSSQWERQCPDSASPKRPSGNWKDVHHRRSTRALAKQ